MSLVLPLTQSWLSEQETAFRPGTARFSWANNQLHLLADLVDEEITSSATGHQQRLWELGDVVELFVKHEGNSDYDEYQIAPNGFTLALHYPDLSCVEAVRRGEKNLGYFFTDLPLVSESTKTEQGWQAKLSVPLKANAGDTIRVSCCRYDYRAERAPILSSTSPHPVRDFHRPQDWREIIVGL